MEIIQPNTTAIIKCDSPLIPKMYKEGNTAVIQCGVPEPVRSESSPDSVGQVIFLVALMLAMATYGAWCICDVKKKYG